MIHIKANSQKCMLGRHRKLMKGQPFHIFVTVARHTCLSFCLYMYYCSSLFSLQILISLINSDYILVIPYMLVYILVFLASNIFGCPVCCLKCALYSIEPRTRGRRFGGGSQRLTRKMSSCISISLESVSKKRRN